MFSKDCKDVLQRILSLPEYIFLFFSVIFGLAFLCLTPPLSGPDENFQYQRIAAISYGHVLNEEAGVPSGIAKFIKAGVANLLSDAWPIHKAYSELQYRNLMRIQLQPESVEILQPNQFTVHHPLSYIPQVIAFRMGGDAGLSPFILLYLTRFAGLVTAIALTFFAIRIIPSHKYVLCAFALLPTISFYRSTLNASQVTDALAFYFIAFVLREVARQQMFSGKNIISLAILAFVMAQCKSAYFLLLFLVIAIPPERFKTVWSRIVSLSWILLPGVVGSIAWIIISKQSYFSGAHYHTWGGDAYPDLQTVFIVHHPFSFLKILVNTLLFTQAIPFGVLGIFTDFSWWQIYFPIGTYIIMIICVFAAAALDTTGKKVVYPKHIGWLITAIFAAFIVFMLTLLYIQWTGLEAPEILGFQGRYIIPLLPLLCPMIRPLDRSFSLMGVNVYVIALATIGLFTSLALAARAFFGQ